MAKVKRSYGYSEILRQRIQDPWTKFPVKKAPLETAIIRSGKVRRLCVGCKCNLSPKADVTDPFCDACWAKQPIQTCGCGCKFQARRARPACITCFEKSVEGYVKGQKCEKCGVIFTAKGYRELCVEHWKEKLRKRNETNYAGLKGA